MQNFSNQSFPLRNFLDLMEEREQVAQLTHPDELKAHLSEGARTAYVGFDATAPSLHVGHLLPIMALRRWQQCGHRVIAVLGGGTTMVGDPTGKTAMRQMLDRQVIEDNGRKIKAQLARFLDFADGRGILVNNADWLLDLNYLEFLREIGPHFSVNRMLTAECFKQRLEKGLSFLEFNYMLLQSYDFLHLYRAYDCTVQMGGDDQWSNILGGMELIRRLNENGKAFCLTVPLLTTADGKKMGKTEKGALWLDPELASAYEYFQFWRNLDDTLVGRCLLMFTELPTARCHELMEQRDRINDAKEQLAIEATALLHGRPVATEALQTARKLFRGAGGTGQEPTFELDRAEFGNEMGLVDALVKGQVFATKSEVRRLIQQGGLAVDGKKVENIAEKLKKEALEGSGVLIKRGKKHYYRLCFSE